MPDALLTNPVKPLYPKLLMVRHADPIPPQPQMYEYYEEEYFEFSKDYLGGHGSYSSRTRDRYQTRVVPNWKQHPAPLTDAKFDESIQKMLERMRATEAAFAEAATPGDELWFFETSLKLTGAKLDGALDRLTAANACWSGTLSGPLSIPTSRYLVAIPTAAAEKLRKLCPQAQRYGTTERLGDALLAFDIWLASAPAFDFEMSRSALQRAFNAVELLAA